MYLLLVQTDDHRVVSTCSHWPDTRSAENQCANRSVTSCHIQSRCLVKICWLNWLNTGQTNLQDTRHKKKQTLLTTLCFGFPRRFSNSAFRGPLFPSCSSESSVQKKKKKNPPQVRTFNWKTGIQRGTVTRIFEQFSFSKRKMGRTNLLNLYGRTLLMYKLLSDYYGNRINELWKKKLAKISFLRFYLRHKSKKLEKICMPEVSKLDPISRRNQTRLLTVSVR